MPPVALLAFAFLVGLTACGMAATLMELAAGRTLSFAEPFVSRQSIGRSVLWTVVAGPFMLGNDALAAWREGRIAGYGLAFCAAAAVTWILAWGVVLLDLASRVLVHLGQQI